MQLYITKTIVVGPLLFLYPMSVSQTSLFDWHVPIVGS